MDGPQRGLHHVHLAQIRRALPAAQYVTDGPVHVRRQRPLALGQPVGEHRRGVQQSGAHADPLRALPGEDQDRPASEATVAAPGLITPVRASPRPSASRPASSSARSVPDHHGPVFEGRPGGEQRPADVGVRGAGGGQAAGQRRRPERRSASGRSAPTPSTARPRPVRRHRHRLVGAAPAARRLGRLLQDAGGRWCR